MIHAIIVITEIRILLYERVCLILIWNIFKVKSTRGRYVIQKSESEECSGGDSSSSEHSSTSRELNKEMAKSDSCLEEDPDG